MKNKIKHQMQLTNNSCGHAILQMVIEYLTNCKVQQKTLMKVCPPINAGISLFDIRKVLENYNINTESYISKDLNSVVNIPLKKSPVLLVVKKESLIHFLLVEKKRFGKFYIHDPAQKEPKWVSINYIKNIWSGVFVIFSFFGLVLGNETKMKKLENYFPQVNKVSRSAYFFSFFTTLVSGFSAIVVGYFFRILFGNTSNDSSYLIIAIIILFFLSCMILQKIIHVINIHISSKYQIKNNQIISDAVYNSVHLLKKPNINRIALLKLIQHVQDYFLWKNKLKIVFPSHFFMTISYIVALSFITWEFSLFIGILVIIITIFFIFVNRKYNSNSEIQRDLTLKSTMKLGLLFDDLELVIYGKLGRKMVKSFNNDNRETIIGDINSASYLNQLFVLSTIAFSLSTAMIYTISIIKIYSFDISFNDIIPALLIVSSFWISFFNLSRSITMKINKKEIKNTINAIEELFLKRVAYLRNVTSFYSFYKKIEFKAGKVYCVVGRNGSGKTTFLKSIFEGKIQANTNIIYNIKFDAIFCSSKGIFDFASIKQNILITDNSSNKLFSKNWIKYQLDKYIDGLNLELNDIVYPNSNYLSNGQQQIINLLRIFSRQDDICLIDEGFNAIDNNLKLSLFKDIKHYLRSKILIFVSHDNKLIEQADIIIKMP